MITRRALLLALASLPLAALGQRPAAPRRIGVLQSEAEGPEERRRIDAFLQGLKESGWIPGQNLQIEYRWGGGDSGRLPQYAAELVRMKPELILASNSLVVISLQKQTKTIPIVFTNVTDPVGSGFVQSLARPGGNLTGVTPFEFSATTKWLELLKQIVPGVTRVAVLVHPDQAPNVGMFRAMEKASPSLGIKLVQVDVRESSDLPRAVAALAQDSKAGLVVLPNAVTTSNVDEIVKLAAKHRVPAVYAYRHFVTAGGLVAYGVDPAVLYRRAAAYADRILKGAKPGDLPIEQPTQFHLVINMRTAKALGLAIPRTTVLSADEVIE